MSLFAKTVNTHIVMKDLPPHVSQVFYRGSHVQAWRNEIGTAFGDSMPHTDYEIRKALTWLVACFGGHITWTSNDK